MNMQDFLDFVADVIGRITIPTPDGGSKTDSAVKPSKSGAETGIAVGIVAGAVIVGALAGPAGAVLGAVIGGVAGYIFGPAD